MEGARDFISTPLLITLLLPASVRPGASPHWIRCLGFLPYFTVPHDPIHFLSFQKPAEVSYSPTALPPSWVHSFYISALYSVCLVNRKTTSAFLTGLEAPHGGLSLAARAALGRQSTELALDLLMIGCLGLLGSLYRCSRQFHPSSTSSWL